MGGGLGRITPHPDYYLPDGSVSFLTGETLFRVHKSYFERESQIFRQLFADANDDPKSGTDERPFTLEVTPEEFSRFLWVWYNRDYSYSGQSTEKWITILRLAKQWGFEKVQALAVRELDALDLQPAERISLYNEHDINGEKLLQSYLTLCRSPSVPTAAEGRLLKMETLIDVLQAREQAQRKAIEAGHETPTSASLDDDALMEIVSMHFKKSLTPRSDGMTTGSGSQALHLNGTESKDTASSGPSETIIAQEPQVPGISPDANSSGPTSNGKENAEKQQERKADKTDTKKGEKEERVAGTDGETKNAQVEKERQEGQMRETKKALGKWVKNEGEVLQW